MRIKQRQHLFLIGIAFFLIYALSLTFVYIEGDDASIISYHVLGRDDNLQSRYALYQAMFDIVLSPLPAVEPTLRVFSICLSALGAVLFTSLAANIAFRWSAQSSNKKIEYVLLFLLLSPELFFAGLYINPSIIAFAFVFLAHIILVGSHQAQSKTHWRMLASALLFGFGVALRWNAALYSIVIFLDLTIPDQIKPHPEHGIGSSRWPSALTWLGLSSLLSLVMVSVSVNQGFSINGLAALPSTVVTYLTGETDRYISLITLTRMMSLFTPLLLILSGVGLTALVKKKSWKIVGIFTAQLLSVLFFILAGRVKESMLLLPLLWVMIIQATDQAVRLLGSRYVMLGLFLLALLPWLIGIRIYSGDTLWGPGFEIREPVRVHNNQNEREIAYAPGIRFGLSSLSPVLDAGFALSSPEGPRPLGGYAFVLLGGRWRTYHQAMDDHLMEIAQAGIASGKIIKLGGGSDARLINTLLREGFITISPLNLQADAIGRLPSRTINHLPGNSTMIYYVYDGTMLVEEDFCAHHPELCSQPAPLMTNYSSDLNALYQKMPKGLLSVLSPFTGVLALESSPDQ